MSTASNVKTLQLQSWQPKFQKKKSEVILNFLKSVGCKCSEQFNYSKQSDQNKLASRFRRLMNFLLSSRCVSPGIELWFTFMDCSVGTLSLKPSIFSGKRGRLSFQRLLTMN